MIVNFERKFVFIHIPKTGGTSLTDALRALQPKQSLLDKSFRKDLNRMAVHPTTKHETYAEFLENFTERTGLPRERALELRPVAFVREPYDRFRSLHRYLLKNHRDTYPETPEDVNAFAEIVSRDAAPWLRNIRSLKPQHVFLECAKEPFVGRFEAMADEVANLETFLETTLDMPHLNRTVPREGTEALTNMSRRMLRERYAEDFKLFGYPA